MNELKNKASNGLVRIGKFHDTFFMGTDVDGKKQVSVVKVIGWVVLLEILVHTMPFLFLLTLMALVAVGIMGGPKLFGDDKIIDGKATVVPEPAA